MSLELPAGTVTVRAPDDYVTDEAIQEPDATFAFLTGDIHNFLELRVDRDGTSTDADLDAFAAARSQMPLTSGGPLARLPDVVVDGRAFYQIAGPDPAYDEWLHEFGVRYDGYDLFVSLRSDLDAPQAERDAVNAAVLASVKLP